MPNPTTKPALSAADPAPAPAEAAPSWTAPGALLDEEALLASRRLLSRLVPQAGSAKEGSLEALLMDLLRPMLAERLNDYLPQVVNRIVAQELARLSTPTDLDSAAEPNAKSRPA